VIPRVHVGGWRCRDAGCERRIFTERPLNVCAFHARQTKRSDEIIAVVGHALGGRPGQRLMGRLGMPLSADSFSELVDEVASCRPIQTIFRKIAMDHTKNLLCGVLLMVVQHSKLDIILHEKVGAFPSNHFYCISVSFLLVRNE
jgi:hypothetical protein